MRLSTEQKLAGGPRRWIIDNLIKGPPPPRKLPRPSVEEAYTAEHPFSSKVARKVFCDDVIGSVEAVLERGQTAVVVVHAWDKPQAE